MDGVKGSTNFGLARNSEGNILTEPLTKIGTMKLPEGKGVKLLPANEVYVTPPVSHLSRIRRILKERHQHESTDLDRRMILNWILRKYDVACRTDSCGSR
jgi:hypothetical protein